jgi:3-oxoacyl-[acyl-carrier-protein] synthase III
VILDAVRERLQLDPAQLAVINPDFGNLSSASCPTAFSVRFDQGPAQYPWTVIAPLGTGLTYGAALLERVRDPDAAVESDDEPAAMLPSS